MRRWLPLLLLAPALLLCSARSRAAALRTARAALAHVARRVPLPGASTADRAALHPSFAARVARVEARLAAEGHPATPASVWRSPRRQATIYALSDAAEALGLPRWTQARGGQSCHNQVAGEAPASAAIDLVPRSVADRVEAVAFYRALGRAAHAEGLRWGGDWSRRNPTWAAYDLGWDPGHIEDRALCRALRR